MRRSWRISAKGSQMRRISCSRRWRSRRSWSMWSRHWRSFTACSGETAAATAALNLRKRRFAAPVHELCDVERFTGMCKDVFGNGTSGFAKDISEHIIQFEAGHGEAFLSTVFSPVSIFACRGNERGRADGEWLAADKGRLDHVAHEQVTNPLGILTVSLVGFLGFGVFGVSQSHQTGF